jgi:hypothetical protein
MQCNVLQSVEWLMQVAFASIRLRLQTLLSLTLVGQRVQVDRRSEHIVRTDSSRFACVVLHQVLVTQAATLSIGLILRCHATSKAVCRTGHADHEETWNPSPIAGRRLVNRSNGSPPCITRGAAWFFAMLIVLIR